MDGIGFTGTSRFEVVRQLGAGGSGVVYEAVDRQQGSTVAIKSLRKLDARALLGFKKEFRALQDLHHPNLVTLGELLQQEGHWFFTMELVRGTDFLTHVRRGPLSSNPNSDTVRADGERRPVGARPPAPQERPLAFDELRLRSCLEQLAKGLAALHGAGKVHRDVKPSNVLVSHEGRVVLLDFGLIADAETTATETGPLVCTFAYVAPEIALRRRACPESDWYSVGVMLYQALTGQLPFDGFSEEILVQKTIDDPAPPRVLVPDAPDDLAELCMELLERDPERRPKADTILRRLGGAAAQVVRARHHIPFVGRRKELTMLAGMFEEVRCGQPVTVFVEGESGIGKTALVRRFLAERDRWSVALAGRCHEREAVPYKAFDEIVDGLSRWLARHDAATLLPEHAELLPEVFPVLRHVEAFGRLAPPSHRLEPREMRTRVFAALRQLLARLARHLPLVIVVDDLQWADADSIELLAAILRPPAPAMLLVASIRTTADTDALVRRLGAPVRRMQLGGLEGDDARELVTAIAAHMGGDRAIDRDGVANEALGHPLFIDALVRHRIAHGASGAQKLEDALSVRIEALPAPARALLEAVAVAGAPLQKDVAAEAAGLAFERFDPEVSILRAGHLVSAGGARRTDAIEVYHDRVREAVVMHLESDALRTWHRRLAAALEASGAADPEQLGVHYREFGDANRAAMQFERAAEQAAQALAFERAARLYQQAIDLHERQYAGLAMLYARLADALVNSGRGADAAASYLAAANASPQDALDLRRRAAEQLLRSGHFDEGIALMRGVLQTVGLSYPSSPRRALLSLLFRRAQIRLRGLHFREQDPAPELLRRIDVCWSATVGLGMVDLIRGNDFQTRHLLLALQAGEPYRVARALAVEAGYLATAGGPGLGRTTTVVEAAQKLAQRVDHPHALALAALFSAYRTFLVGAWAETRRQMESAECMLRDRCSGVAWEINCAQLLWAWSMVNLGEIRELALRLPDAIREAEGRGDLYASTNLRTGAPIVRLLAADAIDEARDELALAMRQWSQQGFHLQHYYDLFGQVQVDLYAGEGARARARFEGAWRALERSLLLRVQSIGIGTLEQRGRAFVTEAAARGGAERADLLRRADKDCKRVERAGMDWSQVSATLLRASILKVSGNLEGAAGKLREAIGLAERADMALHRAAAEWWLGQALGGDEGAKFRTAAETWAAQQAIRNLARMAAMLAPGWG
jgi:hypothetical protein